MLKIMTRLAGTAAFLLLGASTAGAQAGGAVSGTVSDSMSTAPVVGAVVSIGSAPGIRTVRTDETGSFHLPRVDAGSYLLSVRAVGYRPFTTRIVVSGDSALDINLLRLPLALDTMRVVATTQGIYGVIAAAGDFHPIYDAKIQVFGVSVGQTTTDSSGRFFYPTKTAGSYLVRARAPGYRARMVTIEIEAQASVEVSMLLDTTSVADYVSEAAYNDLKDRLARRGYGSIAASRKELMSHGDGDLMSSLLLTVGNRALRLSNIACVYVDGKPSPGRWITDFSASEVELLEVYSAKAEESHTLADRWPRNAGCSYTGMPRPRNATGSDVVRWVAIWLTR